VTICNGYSHAIIVDGSLATTFYGLKLLASPGMGILENGGAGGMVLQNVSIVPGPRPAGATTDRLVSTNSDGTHFITVERGPTIQDCTFANTSDDAVNVHGFYYYVVQKTAPRRYVVNPKWDIGLMAGHHRKLRERNVPVTRAPMVCGSSTISSARLLFAAASMPANFMAKLRTAAFSSAAHGTRRSATIPSHEVGLQKPPWPWIQAASANRSTW